MRNGTKQHSLAGLIHKKNGFMPLFHGFFDLMLNGLSVYGFNLKIFVSVGIKATENIKIWFPINAAVIVIKRGDAL